MKRNFAKIATEQGKIKTLFKFASFVLTKPGFELVKKIAKKALKKLGLYRDIQVGYHDWISSKLEISLLQKEYEKTIGQLSSTPLFSIVMPVYNPDPKLLSAAIDSVIDQLYGNWELCIADDRSPNQDVKKLLTTYADKNDKIKVVFREKNGHISANTNSALSVATGDYIVFMDHDDLLTPNCLFEFVKHINANPQDEIIYSDEDKIDDDGIYSMPHFKPDWAPDNLLSRNYMGHVIVVNRNIMNQTKEIREGFEGSQDHDFLLRATELTEYIGHIPKVLYHWRIHAASVASNSGAKPYAYNAAVRALEEALVRRGTPGKISHIPETLGGYRIHYDIIKPMKVSVIIPTKDQVGLLKCAIDSMFEKTTYPDFEIIVLNNNSNTPEFFELMSEYKEKHSNFTCIEANFPFNFAKLMNIGVAHSKGGYILFANNDIEVIEGNWMSEMVSFAQRRKTGAVGVKLLYKDDTIQHAGVVLGLGGAAGHVFVNMPRDARGYFNYVKSLNNYSAVTAACVMCRKEVYTEVGGMDENLDVEYNDVDMCLKFLTHGYYNVYVPDVEIYHYESATRGHPFQSKESWAQHEKDFGIFRSKWQRLIDNDPFYNPNLSITCTDFQLRYDQKQGHESHPDRPGKNVLVVHHVAPSLSGDAESRTVDNYIHALNAVGCDVHLLLLNVAPNMEEVSRLEKKGIKVLYGEKYAYAEYGWETYLADNVEDMDIVMLVRPTTTMPILRYLRKNKYTGKVIYVGQDLSFITACNEAVGKGDPEMQSLTENVKINEFYMYHSSNMALLSNDEDIAFMKRETLTPLSYVPKYFFAIDEKGSAFEERNGLLFIGNIAHASGIDGICRFIEEVYPLLEKQGIYLTIPGGAASDAILAYSKQHPSITFLPEQSALELDVLYNKSRIAIAPVRLASDIGLRMLEVMSKGLPILGTEQAFETLRKDDVMAYWGSRSADELTSHIVAVYKDENKWTDQSKKQKNYVRTHFGEAKMKESFKNILKNL